MKTGYQVCRNSVVKLEILGVNDENRAGIGNPEFASYTTSKARVLEIKDFYTKKDLKEDVSISYTPQLLNKGWHVLEVNNYKIGEEFSRTYGIHYFNNKDAAVKEFINFNLATRKSTQNNIKFYDRDGYLTSIYSVKDGKRHGEIEAFYRNGQKRFRGRYKNGVTVGYWKYYHSNGNDKMMQNFDENGKLDGGESVYDEEGKIIKARKYNHGDLIKSLNFDYEKGIIILREKLSPDKKGYASIKYYKIDDKDTPFYEEVAIWSE